jgi:ABC-2 type transport system permease protein
MSTAVAAHSPTDVAPLPRVLLAQIKGTLLFYRRTPAFFIFSMVLPIFFYMFFGLPLGNQKIGSSGITLGAIVMAHMGAYAVSSILVFNIGIGQAQRRGQKLDLLQRATPVPGLVVVAAEAAGALVLAFASMLTLFLFATVFGGIRLSPVDWVSLLVRLLVGALPLLGMGLAIGYASGPNAAPAVANLIYLPMSFASGLFIPLQSLPSFIKTIAPYLPTYHYAQLVDGVFGSDESMAVAILWLIGWGIVLFLIAARFYRVDAQRKFS